MSSQPLQTYCPKIESRELQQLMSEMQGQYNGFAFDNTTRLGEAVNMEYRFVQEDFPRIQNRLIDFDTLEKHMSWDELGQHLNDVLTNKLSVCVMLSPHSHLASTCTRTRVRMSNAGSNTQPCGQYARRLLNEWRRLSCRYPAMFDVMCYPHMLYCAGPRFAFTILDDLESPLITIQHMPMVKSL